jgi:hydrogenase expression/formation protein HypC
MKIVAIKGPIALVEDRGVRREARVDLIEAAAVGDYVLVHTGVAIERLDEQEAEETLRLMEGLFDADP